MVRLKNSKQGRRRNPGIRVGKSAVVVCFARADRAGSVADGLFVAGNFVDADDRPVRRFWYSLAVGRVFDSGALAPEKHTRRPSGRAAFQFIYGMARTDWQFLRTVVPMLVQSLLIPLIGIVGGVGHSPFDPGPPTAVHLLPHISGLAGLSICTMLKYSDQYKAAWIFLTAPLDGIQSFVRGIFWALWIPFTIVPLLLVPLFVWSWGLPECGTLSSGWPSVRKSAEAGRWYAGGAADPGCLYRGADHWRFGVLPCSRQWTDLKCF
jgi:hypothetical protein